MFPKPEEINTFFIQILQLFNKRVIFFLFIVLSFRSNLPVIFQGKETDWEEISDWRRQARSA